MASADLLAQLSKLGLTDDMQLEYATTMLLDEAEDDDEFRESALLSLLEDDTAADTELVQQVLGTAKDERVAQARKAKEQAATTKAKSPIATSTAKTQAGLTQEVKERMLRAYGDVAEEDESTAEVIEPAQFVGKGKKAKMVITDPLQFSNDNAARVKAKEQAFRDESAKAAQAKRNKDKADLQKQRDDAERKKKEAQKRAQKQERKAWFWSIQESIMNVRLRAGNQPCLHRFSDKKDQSIQVHLFSLSKETFEKTALHSPEKKDEEIRKGLIQTRSAIVQVDICSRQFYDSTTTRETDP